MADLSKINEYIQQLNEISLFMKSIKEEELGLLPKSDTDKINEITILRQLVASSDWPEAIDSALVTNEDNEDENTDKADTILQEFINYPIANTNFLDFGCGLGYVAWKAADYGTKMSYGYDVNSNEIWKRFQDKSIVLTNNLSQLPVNNFDIVLMYDVLDHVENPVETLIKIKKLKTINGKVHLRCHPWTARHGGHLFRSLNKAYIQLVFTEEELASSLGIPPSKMQFVNKIIDPINQYKEWFEMAGLTILKEKVSLHPIESFFTTKSLIRRRIKQHWRTSTNKEYANGTKFPREVMEIQFADFILN